MGHAGDLIADIDGDDVGTFGRQRDRVRAACPRAAPVMSATLPVSPATSGPQLALAGSPAGWARSIFRSGALARCADLGEQVPTAGAVLWVFSASASAHCLDEHEGVAGLVQRIQLAARLVVYRPMALVQAARTASTDSGLAVNEATMTTGIGWAPNLVGKGVEGPP